MENVLLAIDIVLGALIGPTPNCVDELIEQARRGEVQIIVLDLAIVCALHSVKEGDNINFRRFAELLQYSVIQRSVAPENRDAWTPAGNEIDNWRSLALKLNRSNK